MSVQQGASWRDTAEIVKRGGMHEAKRQQFHVYSEHVHSLHFSVTVNTAQKSLYTAYKYNFESVLSVIKPTHC